MTLDIRPYDPADYLTDDETISYYLIEALEENDARTFARALNHVVRAVGGVRQLAVRTGISEKTLDGASQEDGNPDLATFLKVLAAFKVKVTASRSAPTEDPMRTAA